MGAVVGAVVGVGVAVAHPPRMEAIAKIATARKIKCLAFNSYLLVDWGAPPIMLENTLDIGLWNLNDEMVA